MDDPLAGASRADEPNATALGSADDDHAGGVGGREPVQRSRGRPVSHQVHDYVGALKVRDGVLADLFGHGTQRAFELALAEEVVDPLVGMGMDDDDGQSEQLGDPAAKAQCVGIPQAAVDRDDDRMAWGAHGPIPSEQPARFRLLRSRECEVRPSCQPEERRDRPVSPASGNMQPMSSALHRRGILPVATGRCVEVPMANPARPSRACSRASRPVTTAPA